MQPPRALMRAAVYIILCQNDEVLLGRRCNTGFHDGDYSLVGGHIEEGEAVTQAVLREAEEEAGVNLALTDLQLIHVMQRKNQDGPLYFDFFFIVHHWSGTIQNREPERCDDLRWFPLADLPPNLVPYVRTVLDGLCQGTYHQQRFSEFGWSQPVNASL
jgi:8-oxo-dGTP diphosphatase